MRSVNKLNSYPKILNELTKENLTNTLQFYGFLECAKILRFLSVMVEGETVDMPSLKYILANLNECIDKHTRDYRDNVHLKYFHSLFELRSKIEYVTSISVK